MVYVIEAKMGDKTVFKIGTTANCPWARLDQLRRQNAAPLKLVAAMIGDKTDERRFHGAFEKFRTHGEWFSDCPGIRQLIEDFPVAKWDELMGKMSWGEATFQEAYYHLTTLKFEPVQPLPV